MLELGILQMVQWLTSRGIFTAPKAASDGGSACILSVDVAHLNDAVGDQPPVLKAMIWW